VIKVENKLEKFDSFVQLDVVDCAKEGKKA
jgi:hypothetical protein